MSELAESAVRANVPGGGSAPLTPFAASLAKVPNSGIRELGKLAMSMEGVLRLERALDRLERFLRTGALEGARW
jgi:hypothetical protein